MTILGIDYGTKRVGIAVSDATETLAFPKEVIAYSADLTSRIISFCKSEKARLIILGWSLGLGGQDNPVMEDIRKLKKSLEEVGEYPVVLEQEFFSSQEARRFQGKHAELDASAAAIILQRFLDRQRQATNSA